MGSSVSSPSKQMQLNPEVEVLDDEVCRESLELLNGCFLGCKTDHSKFIRRDEFQLDNLPQAIRHQAVLDMVFHNADLVVKVLRKKDSKSSHPQCGTGSVCYFSDTHDLHHCHHDLEKCLFCHIPDCPYTKDFGEDHYLITNFVPDLTEDQKKRAHIAFRVSTNLHVVGNCREASKTIIELFFDSPKTNSDNSQKIVAKGVCLCAQWDEQDKVHILCVADRSERLEHLLSTMREVFWGHFKAIPQDIKEKLCNDYVILVSHPHGCSKCISIGSNEGCRDVTVNTSTKYVETRYNAVSCKGSSGGVVLGPGWVDGGPAYRVHCGTDDNTLQKVSKSFWVTKGVGHKEVDKNNTDNYHHEANSSVSFSRRIKAVFSKSKKKERCCPYPSHGCRPESI